MPTQTHTAVHHRWSEIAPERIGLVSRRAINGDRMTVAQFEMTRAAKAKTHGHEAEEMLCVVKGALKVTINADEFTVRQGEVMQIPGGIPHAVEALEDSLVIDAFSPLREDWLKKTDTYYDR